MLLPVFTAILLSSFVKGLSLLSISYLAVFFIIELQEFFIHWIQVIGHIHVL